MRGGMLERSRHKDDLADRSTRSKELVGLGRVAEMEGTVDAHTELLLRDPVEDVRRPVIQVGAAGDVVGKTRSRKDERSFRVQNGGVEGGYRSARLTVEDHHAERRQRV